MLGIWARSSLRPSLSLLSKDFKSIDSRYHHASATVCFATRTLHSKNTLRVPLTSTIFKSWPSPRHNSTQPPASPSPSSSAPKPKPSFISRFLPASIATKAPESSSSFRKIVALAKPESKPLGIAIGLLLVSSAVSMSVPFTIGKLIDFFSTTSPQIPFGLSSWQAATVLLFLFTLGAVANAGRAMLMRLSGQRIVARLRERTYSAALRQEVEFVEKGEGDVLSRLSVDTSIVGESVTQNLSDGLRAIVMSTVGLGAMFYVSPTLTMLMLAVVPQYPWVFYGRYLKKLSNKTQEAIGEMTKVASESLSALRTVQSFNATPQEEEKFHEKVAKVLALARREAIASGIFFGSTGWSGNVTILALLGYGLWHLSLSWRHIGWRFDQPLTLHCLCGKRSTNAHLIFSSIMRGIGAGARVFELVDRTPAIPYGVGDEVPKDKVGVVKYERIHFEYPSRKGVPILNEFNLELEPGESVAIVGESGGGKSSVHSLLLRYYDPVQGKITYDGRDIREFSTTSWRSIIGVVPQDPEVEQAAREANCEFIWGMPNGFDTEIGRLSLSGGQRQRLAIARALLKKPIILALDEATSSLDATSERRVNDAIDRILHSRQTTVLFVAHRLSTIARAERIVVLEGGRITESGTYQQLVDRPDSRFRFLMAAQLNAAAGEKIDADSEAAEEQESEEVQELTDIPERSQEGRST
ncbi:P-loop containing nucleoside triphosphate hydrolase protein [Gymnopilus junonius]|uniref:P-loop containing nucleoside triphosphate hydrolase protein n=1 Tax=Gymnopilus junonius TaxID=109634 RepID=A0A9P5TTM9_GYMJU|nr:P-loop containing nucleoside triphosphate hydrolase protein [Gymnopilus junonius]